MRYRQFIKAVRNGVKKDDIFQEITDDNFEEEKMSFSIVIIREGKKYKMKY